MACNLADICTTVTRATCEEICNGPLSFCVQKIQQATDRITNDYIRYGCFELRCNQCWTGA